jgi:hypothetical protein
MLPAPPPAAAAVPPFGNALELDGVNDYANITDNSSLDLGDAEGEDFTIEAFVYVPDETSDANQVIFYKQNAYRLSVNFNPFTADVLNFGVWPAPIGSGDQLLVSSALTAGWHHIAAVYDNEFTSSFDRLSIFLDGALVADASSSVDYTPGINNSTNLLSVGANSGAVPWSGGIEEARFSDNVRYTGNFSVPSSEFASDANTRALWHFNEAACSTSFGDASANANTLSGQNGAQTGVPGAPAPTLQFDSATYDAQENDGNAVVTVTRTGDPSPVVGVNHTTANGTAGEGSDYTAANGTLNFACGDMSETFNVPVTNDALAEGDETVNLSLDTPTGGASLGSPSAATLTIETSDQQPDAWVSLRSASGYIGDNIYNLTGVGQTKTRSRAPGQTGIFYVRMYNDGNVMNEIQLNGTPSPSQATVKYFDGATDISAAMKSEAGYGVELLPSHYIQIQIKLKLKDGATIGSSKTAKVTGTWTGDGVFTDVGRVRINVEPL